MIDREKKRIHRCEKCVFTLTQWELPPFQLLNRQGTHDSQRAGEKHQPSYYSYYCCCCWWWCYRYQSHSYYDYQNYGEEVGLSRVEQTLYHRQWIGSHYEAQHRLTNFIYVDIETSLFWIERKRERDERGTRVE